jgi:hypothetical protein
MRDGIEILAQPEAVERSSSMVAEYDRFLEIAHGKTALLDVGACHGSIRSRSVRSIRRG